MATSSVLRLGWSLLKRASGVGLRSIEISSAGIEEVSSKEKALIESCHSHKLHAILQHNCFAVRLIVEISSSTTSKSTGTLAYLIMRGRLVRTRGWRGRMRMGYERRYDY